MIPLELLYERIQSEFGSLPIAEDDEIAHKLAMLIEGECGSEGIDRAAAKFGLSRQRYFQLRALYLKEGAKALQSSKRGPKSNYRRTQEVVSQVIRHRFLDPEASTEVIAQKLRQCQFPVSKRTVDRVIAHFGLQKKTLPVPPATPSGGAGEFSHPAENPTREARQPQRRTRRPPTAGR